MLEGELREPRLAQGTFVDLDAASRGSNTALADPLTSADSLVRSLLLIFTF